jgi:hypothetical protein
MDFSNSWLDVLEIGLKYGGLMTLVLLVIMTVSIFLAADMWVHDYPPDIREKYGAPGARAKKYRPWVTLAFFGAILLFLLLGLRQVYDLLGVILFWETFLTSFSMLMVYNLFDLLVIDFLVFNIITPKVIVLPGTEGMAGYHNYRFHWIGFWKGTVMLLVVSLVIALLAWVVGLIL